MNLLKMVHVAAEISKEETIGKAFYLLEISKEETIDLNDIRYEYHQNEMKHLYEILCQIHQALSLHQILPEKDHMTMEASGKPVEYDRMSMISRASMAVSQIPKQNIQEMKSFAKPPEAVKDVLLASMLLLGHKESEDNWKMIKTCLGKVGKESLQQRVLELDLDKIPQEHLEKAKAILSKYDVDKISNVSKALKDVYLWADAVADD